MEEEPLSDPLNDGSMRPPQSGPQRTNPVVRAASYSPHTPVYPRQQQPPSYGATTTSPSSSHRTTARFEQSLTSAQVKELKEQFEKSQAKVDLISEVCQQLYGDAPEQDELVRALAILLDSKPELRTFTSLGTRDYDILNPGEQGSIQINLSRLVELVPATSIPNEFWPCLTVLRTVCARRMETGVRQVIGHFLTFAIVIARKLFGEERLVLHTEWDVPATDVPGIGRVHGPLDFLTARAAGGLEMGNITFKTTN